MIPDTYDFFGIKRKTKQNPIFPFIKNVKQASTINQRKNIPTVKTDYWGKLFYRKESINQKHLSKWGDADMDGSPNYFDCDPRNWLKDSVTQISPKKHLEIRKGKKKTKNKEDKKEDSSTALVTALAALAKRGGKKRLTMEEKSESAKKKAEEIIAARYAPRKTLKSEKLAEAEMAYGEAIARGKIPKKKILKQIGEARRRQIIKIAPKEEEIELPEIKYKTKTQIAQLTKLKRKRYEESISPKAVARMERKRKKLIEKEKIKKQIEKEIEATERVKPLRESAAGRIIGKAGEKIPADILEKMQRVTGVAETGVSKVTKVLKKVQVSPDAIKERAIEVAKATPKALRATYGKEERIATQKVRRLVKGAVGGIFGASLLQTRFGPAVRGRPSGPSGRYMIEGKPVFEEQYQKWASEQRALNRITPSTAQQAPLTQEEQMTPQQIVTSDETRGYPSTSVPMTPGEIQESKTTETFQRGPTAEEVRMAQELAQQQDNIMNAPNILKGELKATGGSLLTPTGPQIMDAPNAFKGQLRNLNRESKSIDEIKLGMRPQTNPMGEEYIDIELGSNKPVLKRRIRERWITGESL